tara:strand:- start:78 stop:323 length:246 start_codon:yes stop_codon:yes gene_type:complete
MKIVDDNGNIPKEDLSSASVDFKNADDVICEKCECKIFQEKMMIKKISKFITGAARDQIAPIPVIVCADCNHINEIFKPNL